MSKHFSPEQIKRRNLWMYPLGTVGRDMTYSLFTNFILTYVMFTRQLTAAQLTAITAIMVAARVFDALNDPLMGNIIERTRTRFGKYKPWLAIGILATSGVIALTFNSRLQGWSFIAFFAGMYFLFSIAYTMHDISYWGMTVSLSSDADARNQYTSRATLFAGIGGAVASMLIPMFTTGGMTLGGNAQTAYGIIALIFSVIGPLFLCFTIFGVRETRQVSAEKAPSIGLKKIFATIKGNDQLRWIAVIFLFHQLGSGLAAAGLCSTYVYLAFGYEGGMYALFNTIGLLATGVIMMVFPMLSRRFTRKQMMDVMMLANVIGSVIMLAAGLLLKGSAQFVTMVVGYMIANIGQYCFYLMMMISIFNTVEYNELLHGTRDEAIITSLRPFLTKLSSAIIVALTSLTYIVFGVTGVTNRISEMENAAANGLISEADKLASIGEAIGAVQPWQTIGLLLCLTVLPCVLLRVSHVLYKKHYKLDEKEYARICAELAARQEVQA